MKELFLLIRELLKDIPELKWVDLEKGQLDFSDTPPVDFPCALIKIELPRCENIISNIQTCQAMITIRLASRYSGETSAVTSDAALGSATAFFDAAQKVYLKLQGYSSGGMRPFTRKGMREETRRDGLKVVQLVFETEFKDKTAAV
jgi:hypothetical protein